MWLKRPADRSKMFIKLSGGLSTKSLATLTTLSNLPSSWFPFSVFDIKFQSPFSEPETVFKGLEIAEDLREELLLNIRRRMTPQAVKVRADIEVTCFRYEGVDAVKAALLAGEACKKEEVDIKIKLVAPPLYVMFTHCMDKQLGIETLEKAIVKIEEVIKKLGGDISVKMKVSTNVMKF